MDIGQVQPALRDYVEREIIPRYAFFDQAHREDHVRTVIGQSLSLAAHYNVDANLVYVAAACHDLGLAVDRRTHHLESGKWVRAEAALRTFFTPEQIETIAQAVEDHRASSDHDPRSLYGRILAEADRVIDPETIVRRTVQYGMDHYPQLDEEGHWRRTLDHLLEKYAEGGYLKLYIPESPNAARLAELRDLIRDRGRLKAVFKKIFRELSQ